MFDKRNVMETEISGKERTDVVEIDGKSIRDHTKDGISGFFGWN